MLKTLSVALIALLTFNAFAQYPIFLSDPNRILFRQDFTFVPNTLTAVTNKTIDVDLIWLSNNTASAVTVTLQDQSTNCNSGACNVLPTVSIQANTAYILSISGSVRFLNGIKWQASSSNAIVGYVRGATNP